MYNTMPSHHVFGVDAVAANTAWLQAYHGILPALWNCRLTEVKKWLGVAEPRSRGHAQGPDAAPRGDDKESGDAAATPATLPPKEKKKALPRGRSARQAPIPGTHCEWLALLNMIPLQAPQGPGKGAAPIALYRVVLKYAEDRGFLTGLARASDACIEGYAGACPGGWRCTLYDLLASTPGGAEELERIIGIAGEIPHGGGRTGDPYYDHYIPKALRHATLADVKRMMRWVSFPAGPDAPPSARNPWIFTRGAPHERWVEAACATRHAAVFEFALQRFGPSTHQILPPPYPRQAPLPPHRWWGFLVEAGHAPRDLEPRLALLLKEGEEDLGRLLSLARPLAPPPYLSPQRKIIPGCDPRETPDGGVLHYALVLLICPELATRKRRALLPKNWWEKIPSTSGRPPAPPPFALPPLSTYADYPGGLGPFPGRGAGALDGLTALTREEAFLAAPAEAQERAVSYLLWLYAGWVWESKGPHEGRGVGALGWATALHRRWPRLSLAPIYSGVLEILLSRRGACPRRCLLAYLGVAGAGILRLAVAIILRAEATVAQGGGIVSRSITHTRKMLASVIRAHLLCVRGERRLFARRGKAFCRALGDELEWLPPREDGPLVGGGAQVGRLGSSWTHRSGRAFGPPPAHCEPEELAWCAVHPGRVVLSAKADGVHYQGGAPPGTFPPVPPAFSECLFQAERVSRAGGTTLWLVYDVAGEDLLDHDLAERMGAFRAALGFPPAPPGPGGCRDDDLRLAGFLATVPDGQDALWPKWTWALPSDHPPAAFLELVAAPPPVGTYLCDGWVCAPRLPLCPAAQEETKCTRTIKIKPLSEMTADLLWRGAGWEPATSRGPEGPPPEDARGVWRCAWSEGGWAPRDFRPEKERPNPDWLVAALERANLAPWSPRDLVPFLAQRHYASAPSELTASSEAFLRRQRASVRAWLESEGVAAAGSVFDAGCGRGSHCHPAPGHWTGVDRDPAAVAEARMRRGSPRATWIWAEMGGLAHPLTREPIALRPGSYDFLVAVHSFHSAAESVAQWDGWVRALTRLAAPGAVFCLRTVDPLALFAAPEAPAAPPGLSLPEVVHLPGGSWFRRENDGSGGPARPPGAVRVRTSLAWAASGGCPRSEWFVPPEVITDSFTAAGWVLRGAARPKQEDAAPSGWETWTRAETDLVFVRPAR